MVKAGDFKAGDKVKYKDEIGTPVESIFLVYGVYSKTEVSLTLRDWPDTEQDYLTDIKDIVKA